jgi:hypothetical protein
MAEIVYAHAPNRATMSHEPASTDWAQVTLPTGVPSGSPNVNVILTCMDSTGVADGDLILIDFNKASAPSVGFPIREGQTLSTTLNTNLWIKLTTGTDEVKILFLW